MDVQNAPVVSLFETRLRGFESAMRREGIAESTLATYRRFLVLFGAWLGQRDPGDVRKLTEVEEYFDCWEADYDAKYSKRPSNNTQRIHQTALSTFFDYMLRRDYADLNPLAKMKRAKATSKKGDSLSDEEFTALLNEPRTPQERIIVAVYSWTAARANEVIQASQGDVNLQDLTIAIRTSKTASGVRVVPILPELEGEIRRWFDYLKEHKRGLRDDRLPLLVTENKTAMKHSYAWRVLKRVAARAGVRRQDAPDKAGENVSTVTLHTLRRTLSNRLLNGYGQRDPVRVEALKAFLGHSDIRITLGYYAEVEQGQMMSEIRKAVGT